MSEAPTRYGSTALDYSPEDSRAAGRQLLKDIDRILPFIEARAGENEKQGRVGDAIVEALTGAGMFRSLTPHQYGGLEIDPAAFNEATYRIASRCASSGWVAGLVAVHNWQIAHFSKKAQDEYFSTGPDTRASSSYAPTGNARSVGGGFELSGRWDFSSGVDHAEWAILGAVIRDIEAPEFRSFLVNKHDLTILEGSWNVTGLRGTGSKSVSLDNVFVPDHMTHRIVDVFERNEPGMSVNDRPLYRLPWLSIFWYAIGACAIGAAQGGIDAFIAINRKRIAPSSQKPAAMNPFLHVRTAEAQGAVDLHHARMIQNWDTMFEVVTTGQEVPQLMSRRSRFESANAVTDCYRALGGVYQVAGGGVINETNPIQRFYRDLMAMVNHPTANMEGMATLYSQSMFGVPATPFDRCSMGALAATT
jgi:3-hydroxy-9,10-secoandrosta-1,3,5(10)-triene-9,17-dione monooxygenase